MQDLSDLRRAWDEYRLARLDLLSVLDLSQSNRDPLGEFAEVLVARVLDGTLAPNRVQKAWDVESPIGFVQVKYLANPSQGPWVNWHTIEPADGMDWYALVLYLDLSPAGVYIFPRGDLTRFCHALNKRHGSQGTTLQFTKTNHLAISADPQKFETLGMRVFLLDAL